MARGQQLSPSPSPARSTATAPRRSPMHCPFCRHTDTRVVDSPGQPTTAPRSAAAASARECGRRFTTVETAQPRRGQALRRHRAVQPRQGRSSASARPARAARSPRTTWRCSAQRVEEARAGQRGAPRSTPTRSAWPILGPLRELDEVAYLRFARVYRAFESLEDFEAEIALLRAERDADRPEPSRRAAGRRPGDHRPPGDARRKPRTEAAVAVGRQHDDRHQQRFAGQRSRR